MLDWLASMYMLKVISGLKVGGKLESPQQPGDKFTQ